MGEREREMERRRGEKEERQERKRDRERVQDSTAGEPENKRFTRERRRVGRAVGAGGGSWYGLVFARHARSAVVAAVGTGVARDTPAIAAAIAPCSRTYRCVSRLRAPERRRGVSASVIQG